jgi:hypothetical protein
MTPDVLSAVYDTSGIQSHAVLPVLWRTILPQFSEAVYFFKMLVTIHQTTWYHIPEGTGEIVLLTNFYIMVISKMQFNLWNEFHQDKQNDI